MSVDAAVRKAETLVELGRFAQAETAIRRHLTGSPHDAVALGVLGRAQLAQDRAQEALATAGSAIAENPNLLQPRLTLAEAYVRLRQFDEALRAADEYVAMAPGSWQAHYTRARTRLNAGGRHTVDALPEAIEAVRLAPNLAEPHVLVGHCYNAATQPWRAAEAFRNALAIDPEHVGATRHLALAELRAGRRRTAIGGLTSAVRLDPTDDVASTTLETVQTIRTGRLLLVVYFFSYVEMFLGVVRAPWLSRAGLGAVVLVVSALVLVVSLARVPRGRRRSAMVRTWTMIAERIHRPLGYYVFCTVGGLAIAAWPTATVYLVAIVFGVIWVPVTLFFGIAARRARRIGD